MNTLESTEPDAATAVAQARHPYFIRLPLGLLGFEAVKSYELQASPEDAPLMWLRMRDGGKHSFRVALAEMVQPDYQPDISDQDAAFLGLTDPSDAVVLNIVTVREGQATLNLKGPIVLNRHSMVGKQVIPRNAARFDARHPLRTPLPEKPAAKMALPPKMVHAPLLPQPRRKFRESKLAHQFLDGLQGLEIGGSAHNSFGLKTRNVDFCADLDTIFKKEEIRMCGEMMKVDIVASGDNLPLPDNSEDFVISSHVIEHFFDPIKTIEEWLRVVRPGGYIFIVAPHKERTFDKNRPRTPLQELLDRHSGRIPTPAVDTHGHYSVWITEDMLELSRHMRWNVVAHLDVDDKVGNGFTILLQKPPPLAPHNE